MNLEYLEKMKVKILKMLNKMNLHEKIANQFTDTFQEQLEDYLLIYGLENTDENIEKVLAEIVKIYKSLI